MGSTGPVPPRPRGRPRLALSASGSTIQVALSCRVAAYRPRRPHSPAQPGALAAKMRVAAVPARTAARPSEPGAPSVCEGSRPQPEARDRRPAVQWGCVGRHARKLRFALSRCKGPRPGRFSFAAGRATAGGQAGERLGGRRRHGELRYSLSVIKMTKRYGTFPLHGERIMFCTYFLRRTSSEQTKLRSE